MTGYRTWTLRQEWLLTRLARKGWPPHAIALVLPHSRDSIRARLAYLRKLGVEIPRFRAGGTHQGPVDTNALLADLHELHEIWHEFGDGVVHEDMPERFSPYHREVTPDRELERAIEELRSSDPELAEVMQQELQRLRMYRRKEVK